MSWALAGQVAGLMILSTLLAQAIIGTTIDKRRDDAVKRKDAGL